jgi:hypothetical protein
MNEACPSSIQLTNATNNNNVHLSFPKYIIVTTINICSLLNYEKQLVNDPSSTDSNRSEETQRDKETHSAFFSSDQCNNKLFETMLSRRLFPSIMFCHFLPFFVVLLFQFTRVPSVRATEVSYTCSTEEAIVLTNTTKELVLVPSFDVCLLWRITTNGARVPVARSYQGKHWEAYSGPHARQRFRCNELHCQTTLPETTDTVRYELMAYAPKVYTHEETAARFLEQTTFGPRLEEIQSFGKNVSIEALAHWIQQQEALPITSHRAEFRKRVNHRYPANGNTLVGRVTHPCQAGTRYRKAALSDKDQGSMLEIRTSSSSSQKVLLVDGKIRTVVNATTLSVKNAEDATSPPEALWDGM